MSSVDKTTEEGKMQGVGCGGGLGASAPMCPPDCGHSAAEHEAFDAGVMTGEREGWEAKNPYSEREQYDLWDAWETGASVGRMAYVEPEQSTYTTT